MKQLKPWWRRILFLCVSLCLMIGWCRRPRLLSQIYCHGYKASVWGKPDFPYPKGVLITLEVSDRKGNFIHSWDLSNRDDLIEAKNRFGQVLCNEDSIIVRGEVFSKHDFFEIKVDELKKLSREGAK